ncbi:MAG: FMN-binding glutamate synthase family protein, partial [Candidatus Bathyarchaeia archaeon]
MTPSTVSAYKELPKQVRPEFWDKERIEHIRALASTGDVTRFWTGRFPGLRILDRIAFRTLLENTPADSQPLPPEASNRWDTTVALAYNKLTLSAPLYLGDMSFGALSGVPNIALAKAADLTGVLAGTGEGGLMEDVKKCRRITVQWASARFGVDHEVLNAGLAVVIKIGQGAKPGIGGHLPGAKVTHSISAARRIPPGKDAISPAPHHDIYSIEDLGQRIWALKEATRKPIFVKVGATNYIPYIASGVARMGADGVIIDGCGAGTGAAPKVVKDNVGLPIEIAVPAVDKMLRRERLREGFSVIAAGMVGNPMDAAKLIALGADAVSIGTAALVAMGCLMVHKCHLGYCPALLTNKISSVPSKVLSLDKCVEWVVNLVNGWTAELRQILRSLNIPHLAELMGRRDLLVGVNLHHETLDILGVQSLDG